MRIISQNGAVDVPYEMSAICNDDKLIILCMAGETGKGSVIATYSTSEKAKKAMEMLHKAYIGMPIIAVKDVEIDVKRMAEDIRNGFVQPMPLNEQKIECDIFRFPQDEDVEV